ncbi:hypothetical protein OPV22_034492 [Ensete ventricosum]|uniref:Uncharacterized protein n=1 Tax=Ensete ventricosum TaxID=4639 RepID=A0AAV8PSQ9_ENSVE|nr:hypothetical protein OPV22_034492 [Ensete ventricosum]
MISELLDPCVTSYHHLPATPTLPSRLDTVKQAHLHNNGETSDLSIYIKYPEFDLAGGWWDGCRFGRWPTCWRLQDQLSS